MAEDDKKFLADRNVRLDKKAFRQACATTEKNSVLVDLSRSKDVKNMMDSLEGFDYRLVNLVNKYCKSPDPDEVADLIHIGDRTATEYMRENGYTFMDCVVEAQHAIERNKPAVTLDVDVPEAQNKFESRVNLSDPSFMNVPPSHKPRLLDNALKIISLGFYQNRHDRAVAKKELEMIRMVEVNKRRQSVLKDMDKSQYAEETRRKKEQNKEMAEEQKEKKEQFKQNQKDEVHSEKGLKHLESYKEQADKQIIRLEEQKKKLEERLKENAEKRDRITKQKEEADNWMKDNPNWKQDPEKRKEAHKWLEALSEYNAVTQEQAQLIRQKEKTDRLSQRLMTHVSEMEGKRNILTDLYKKQGEHKLSNEERKQLQELEKPGGLKELQTKVIDRQQERQKQIEALEEAQRQKVAEAQKLREKQNQQQRQNRHRQNQQQNRQNQAARQAQSNRNARAEKQANMRQQQQIRQQAKKNQPAAMRKP